GSRPRPTKFARLVSHSSGTARLLPGRPLAPPRAAPGVAATAEQRSTTETCASHGGSSSAERGRRVQSSAPTEGSISVCTNRFWKAGWARSAVAGAKATSAKLVTSSSTGSEPALANDRRRTSAFVSGDTTTSINVSTVPSRRRKRAASGVYVTWYSSAGFRTGWKPADHSSPVVRLRTYT